MPGYLGFELKGREPEPNDPPMVHTVAVIRPDGPAAGSGLKVGDVIVSVNGQNVTPPDDFLYFALVEVARGTALKLGLARGATVTIKVGDPL